MFNHDPLGKILTEIRDNADVAAIVGANPTSSPARVRGFEPAPTDAQGPGSYRAFVVLVNEGGSRFRTAPVARWRIAARCYGRTPAEAAQLGVAVSNAIHNVGPRIRSSLILYRSYDDAGGEQDSDPDTDQPYVTIFIDLFAATQVAAV
jgi:hypothetical protein